MSMPTVKRETDPAKKAFARALSANLEASGFTTLSDYAKSLKTAVSTVSRYCDPDHHKMPSIEWLNRAIKPFTPDGRVQVLRAYFAGSPLVSSYLNPPVLQEIDDTPHEIRAILKRLGTLATDFKEANVFLTTLGRIMFRPQPPAADPYAERRMNSLRRGFYKFLKIGTLTPQEFKIVEKAESQ